MWISYDFYMFLYWFYMFLNMILCDVLVYLSEFLDLRLLRASRGLAASGAGALER